MGRAQWESVVAAAARQSMVTTDASMNGLAVPVGGTGTIDFYAPAGFIGLLKKSYIASNGSPADQGAISGDYTMGLSTSIGLGSVSAVIAPFDKTILFNRSQWAGTWVGAPGGSKQPESDMAVIEAIRDFPFDNVIGLRLFFSNNTNKALVMNLTWNFSWLKILTA